MTTPHPPPPPSSAAKGTASDSFVGVDVSRTVRTWNIVHGVVFFWSLFSLGAWFVLFPDPSEVSLVENRRLATIPTITWEGLRDGEVTRALEAWIADHFPLREQLVRVARVIKDARGVDVDPGFTATKGQEDGLENLEDWAFVDEDGGVAADEDAGAPSASADAGSVVVDAGPRPDTTRIKEGVLRVEDRGLLLFRGGDKAAIAFADVVNAYADALTKEGVQLSLVVTPTSSAFYLPESAVGRTLDEPHNLDVMKQRLSPNVRVADVYGQLKQHTGEDIFFKSDHHWTGLGAYYGYRAWADVAGVPALALESFEKKTRPGAPGSLWRMSQDPKLQFVDKAVDYFVPPVVVDSSLRFYGPEQKQAAVQSFFVHSERGYLVWFGSDWPLMVAKTQANTGRRVLLVKNSFGNAFAPYLLSHHDVVVVVDYRYSVRSVLELVKTHAITEVILLNATSTANSSPHAKRLRQVLKTGGQAWETEAEKKRREEAEKADAGVAGVEEK